MEFLLIGFEKVIANFIGIKRSLALQTVSGVINRSTSKHPDQVLTHALFFRIFVTVEAVYVGGISTYLRCENSDIRKNKGNQVRSALVMSQRRRI